MPNGPFIYRFANDLRLSDHAGLLEASRHGRVLPVLTLERDTVARLNRSPRRAAFFCGAVAALDDALRQRGSRLIVRRGPAGAALTSIARATAASGVAWSASYDALGVQRDALLQSRLEESGLQAIAIHDAPVVAPEETMREGGGYRAFAAYFNAWCERARVAAPLEVTPEYAQTDLHSEPLPSAREFSIGEIERRAGPAFANARLDAFMDRDATSYALAAMVPAEDRTSALSVHLAFGTIAARTIARAVRNRMDDPFLLAEERLSLKQFLRSLARRDFFLQLAWFQQGMRDEPLQEKMRGFVWSREHPGLAAWREGATGYPLVDAGVRQLRATGTMHPHVRAVAASFLCFDLGVDWRVGRDEWERWSCDDDRALSIGNWQWIAGVGADMAQYPRIYNPLRQQLRYDPLGAYVKRWIPELASLPFGRVERAGTQGQLELELFGAVAYPKPVVEHGVRARAFLARYRRFLSQRRGAR